MPRLIHLTTTDISLELLLGPQLSAFSDAGYEVMAASAPGPFVEAVEARGVEFIPLENATRSMALGSDLLALREVYGLFREIEPDIVHTHNPKPGVYGRIAARVARVPVVVNTVHGLYAQPSDALARRSAVYSLERLAAGFSDAELVQNPEDVAVLRRLRVPESRIHLLGNGVDLERFRPPSETERAESRADLGVDEDDIVIGAVGRLVLEKGYAELFEAFGHIRRTHPTAKLVVVGPHEPDKADALGSELMAEAEAAGVSFLGHQEDVESLYWAMDIYVLASHREGFPRSAMEAAACGLPIVATNIRGCRQVVTAGTNGMLVPVRDARAFAEALSKLVSDTDLRERMSAAAVIKARDEFDQQQVIDTTLAVYERLLEQKSDSPD
ncbi:MAG: glycosyltransferase family 4 protein [Acidimicrobiales bacterium]